MTVAKRIQKRRFLWHFTLEHPVTQTSATLPLRKVSPAYDKMKRLEAQFLHTSPQNNRDPWTGTTPHSNDKPPSPHDDTRPSRRHELGINRDLLPRNQPARPLPQRRPTLRPLHHLLPRLRAHRSAPTRRPMGRSRAAAKRRRGRAPARGRRRHPSLHKQQTPCTLCLGRSRTLRASRCCILWIRRLSAS